MLFLANEIIFPSRNTRTHPASTIININFKKTIAYETKENAYELGVKAAVLQIIFLLIRMYPSREIVSSPDREQLKEVLQEISVKSSENLSVADMAKFCGHFMRWFKKMTGDSFTSYVNDRRLAEAAEALRQTDDKILTISQDAGFMNLSNFNRQFKKRYGVTPREYREMIGI